MSRDLPEQLVGHVLLTQSNNESISRFQHAQEIGRPSSAPPILPSEDEPQVCWVLFCFWQCDRSSVPPIVHLIMCVRLETLPLRMRFQTIKLTFTALIILLITTASNLPTSDCLHRFWHGNNINTFVVFKVRLTFLSSSAISFLTSQGGPPRPEDDSSSASNPWNQLGGQRIQSPSLVDKIQVLFLDFSFFLLLISFSLISQVLLRMSLCPLR